MTLPLGYAAVMEVGFWSSMRQILGTLPPTVKGHLYSEGTMVISVEPSTERQSNANKIEGSVKTLSSL